MDVYAWLLIIFMLIGLVGTLLPLVPGVGLIFVGIVIYGLFDQWVSYSVGLAVVAGILTVVAFFIDQAAGSIGAKKFGASTLAALGALLGSIVGGIVFNVPGLLAGGLLGSVGIELYRQRNLPASMRAATGVLVGTAIGAASQFVVALVLVIYTISKLWGAA